MQAGDDHLGGLHRLIQPDAARRFLQKLDPARDACGFLLAEARQRCQRPVLDGRLQVADALDAQPFIHRLDPFRAHAGDVQQFEKRRGDSLQKLLMRRDPTALDELADLGQARFADPRRPGQPAVFQQHAHVGGQFTEGAGDLAVAVDAEGVLSQDLHDIGHLLEDRAEYRVSHRSDYMPWRA